MKKGTLFKILTLFLTFVIFSCCSGCLMLIVEMKSKQDTQRRIEIQKERKAQADALIPEIDGYVFEALPQDAFISQEDWESKGFLDYNAFKSPELKYEYRCEIAKNDEHYMFNVKLHYRSESSPGDIDIGKIVIGIQEYEERLLKYFKLFTQYGTVVCCDNNFFMIVWMETVIDSLYPLNGPPALFLLDFENNTILYAGYAKGWFEYEIEHRAFYRQHSVCYKLTKEVK